MRRPLAVLLVAASLLVRPAYAAPATMVPLVEGPDVPPTTAPAASVTVFDKTPFFFNGKGAAIERTVKARLPKVPAAGWHRVVLRFTDNPSADDPWDRVFSFSAGGVELLRGTTPRSDMTVTRDISAYAAVFGKPVGSFTASVGTYVGSHKVTAVLDFYTADHAQATPFASVVPAIRTAGIEPEHADPKRRAAVGKAVFGRTAPASALVELTTTGHLQGGEFWYLPDRGSTTPPVLHVLLDGTEIATARALPYVYALVGFDGGNGTEHPLMWWTAQQALDSAGAYTGVGEIPPYRAGVPAAVVAKLTGKHTVTVTVDGKGLWITSVAFLLS